jgi:hypothetical protein
MGLGSRCARHEASRRLGGVADRFRDGAKQGCHSLEQRFDRTETGKVEENPVLVLFDLSSDFEEGEDDSRRLRLGEGGMGEGVRP